MNIWTYCIIHNEAPMLPYFLRHYANLSERVILFDDHSTDGGPELAAAYSNVEVRPYPHQGLDDLTFVEFAATTYPEARGQADWVLWVDCDEFVYHPWLRMVLGRYMASGVTLPLIDGYAMLADHFPVGPGQIYDEIKTGLRYAPESKRCVLNPRLELRWGAGKHALEQDGGGVASAQAEIKLLHYRHLGGAWFDGRNARNGARVTERNRQHQLGWQVYPENFDKANWATQQDMLRDARVVV